jgi:hypothetical protein
LPQFCYSFIMYLSPRRLEDMTLHTPVFGPEWYEFQAPPRHCPVRRVVKRVVPQKGKGRPQETLDCGHTIFALKRPSPTRRCTLCEPLLPSGEGREVIVNPIVPYQPGHHRKRGWVWVSDPTQLIPCLRPTPYLLMHPEFHERWKKEKCLGRYPPALEGGLTCPATGPPRPAAAPGSSPARRRAGASRRTP